MTKNVVQKVRFPASAKEVYALYADPKKHAAAIGASVKFSPKVGSNFAVWDGYATGRILDLQPGKRIVQTWRAADWKSTDPDSILILTFTDAGKGCVVQMVHANVPDGEAANLRQGWTDNYWTPFKLALKA